MFSACTPVDHNKDLETLRLRLDQRNPEKTTGGHCSAHGATVEGGRWIPETLGRMSGPRAGVAQG